VTYRTSLHWHGLRQFHTNMQDGANGVTECPLAPNKTKTYTFKATQYGTSWFHSHFSAQYGNGVYGTILIDGPASANYDIDLGVFPISDYYYNTAESIVALTTAGGRPPPSDNILFNGTNVNPKDTSKGQYAKVTLTPKQVHRLRLINPSVENHYQVTLVGHKFTIIATDLVPVTNVTTDSIFLGVGQRYDVLIDASATPDNYWFNVTVQNPLCGASNNPWPAAIFQYDGVTDALPTDVGTKPADANCVDSLTYEPVVQRAAIEADFTPSPANNLSVSATFTTPVTWFVNGSAINVQWDKPVLEYIIEGNTSYPASENLVIIDEKDVWTYWVVQNLSPLPHPMHLHGHDFLVLGHSPSPASALTIFSDADKSSLSFDNPTRRDVTMLPANGWVVLAFKADNPGNWLMHCHIAWHVSGGLSVDFLEQRDAQLQYISDDDKAKWEQTCSEWIDFEPLAPARIDSGLR
jgi:FtsP/CotA-like multicopper oxidase with cupredoxin domain